MGTSMLDSGFTLSGWALREFSVRETQQYCEGRRPSLLELSKDQVSNVSIKELYKVLDPYRESMRVAYAGTTDFIDLAGLQFDEYLNYTSIQIAQARFLRAEFFRALVGRASADGVIKRLRRFADLIAPMRLCIEIHRGWESQPENIETLVYDTDFMFVIDFQNLLFAELSFDLLKRILPATRIAYFHSRNIAPYYIEHEESVDEEATWSGVAAPTLWEPKTISKQGVIEVLGWE